MRQEAEEIAASFKLQASRQEKADQQNSNWCCRYHLVFSCGLQLAACSFYRQGLSCGLQLAACSFFLQLLSKILKLITVYPI